MSNPRFSPITSDLLARKGDATPSTLATKPSLFWRRAAAPVAEPLRPAAEPVRPAAEPARPAPDLRMAPDLRRTPEPPPAAAPPPLPDGPRPHKMMVTLSAGDYEKLGIAAVKKGLTRHQLLRVAIDLHLERLKREYGGCGCMALGPGNCGEGCGT
jgi:hypothetical protein